MTSAAMTGARLAAVYAAFAAAATVLNLLAQHAVLAVGGSLLPAMAAGTLAGLAGKYWLDKRWIFADRSTGWANHSRKFALYSLGGVATTALFWAVELAFDQAFGTAVRRDVGAVLGLALGYAVKYWLDRRLVFPAERPA